MRNGRLLDPAKSASYGAAFLWIANLQLIAITMLPHNETSKSVHPRNYAARIKPQTLGRKVKRKKICGHEEKVRRGKYRRADSY
jgi:hypothetical protein